MTADLLAMARKSEFRQVQPVAEKHEQPDQNKCRSDDRITVFADDFLQGVGVRPFAQQGNECQPDPRIRENSPGSVEQSVAENTVFVVDILADESDGGDVRRQRTGADCGEQTQKECRNDRCRAALEQSLNPFHKIILTFGLLHR